MEKILSFLATAHYDVLFLLGLAALGGVFGGKFFQRLKFPRVIGYILIGIFFGQTGLKVISQHTVNMLHPLSYFALGLIGFIIGGELKKSVFEKYGNQFLYILIGESFGAFIFVSILVFASSVFFLGFKMALIISLLLGAISSATAPAVTSNVLWEYKTRGPLTTTTLGIVALDDSVALILFAIVSSIVVTLTSGVKESLFMTILHPLYDIFGAVIVGSLLGWLLVSVAEKWTDDEAVLTLSVGIVLFTLGFAHEIKVGVLLAAMAAGVVVTNYSVHKSKLIFGLLEKFAPPIFVLFFVLFGAKLNVSKTSLPILLMIIVYFIGRTSGKMLGAKLGARLGKAVESVRKYLPYCLFSQAGVAIGFSIIVAHKFPGQIGDTIIIVITITTFIVEMIGPPSTKWAMTKAGEVGLNITEEDLMKQGKVEDIMDKEIPLLYSGMILSEILKIFSEHTNLYYPVVDRDKKLLGIVTIDTIKDTFMSSELHSFLVAYDLMSRPVAWISPSESISKANEMFQKYNIDSLPVVASDGKVMGVIEARAMRKLISRKLMELQKRVS